MKDPISDQYEQILNREDLTTEEIFDHLIQLGKQRNEYKANLKAKQRLEKLNAI